MALFLGSAGISGCHDKSVDADPSINVANNFYQLLSVPDVKSATTLFSPGFTDTMSSWPKVLSRTQSKFGPVVHAELELAVFTPDGDSDCYLLKYNVIRQSLQSHERLLVCKLAGTSRWAIVGHELTRDDTGNDISGGRLPNRSIPQRH